MTPAPLSKVFRKMREAKGLSRRQLAKAAGVSMTKIYHLEHGIKTQPTRDELQKLAAALGGNLE